MDRSIISVKLTAINEPTDPLRNADDQEKIAELAHSLLTLGQLQNIVVKEIDGRYELIAGRRRYRAARLAGLESLNALILDPDTDTGHLQTLQENLFRVPLSALEEADAIGFLHYDRRWEVRQIAAAMHKSPGWVEDRISLLHTPDEIKAAIRDGQIGLGVALELGSIPDQEARAYYLSHAQEHGITVDIARRWRVDFFQQQTSGTPIDPSQTPTVPRMEVTPTTFECWLCEDHPPIAHIQIVRMCPTCVYNLQRAKAGTAPPE